MSKFVKWEMVWFATSLALGYIDLTRGNTYGAIFWLVMAVVSVIFIKYEKFWSDDE